jgi:hypothetical protein
VRYCVLVAVPLNVSPERGEGTYRSVTGSARGDFVRVGVPGEDKVLGSLCADKERVALISLLAFVNRQKEEEEEEVEKGKSKKQMSKRFVKCV